MMFELRINQIGENLKDNKMRVGCDVCHREEAAVLCFADEAALCRKCDAKVHAANKLAGKHQRLPLFSPSSSSSSPSCDICQEKRGYFFCMEDRALLCRQCDYSVHTANDLVRVHQRYIVTGVRVGLEPSIDTASITTGVDESKRRLVSQKTVIGGCEMQESQSVDAPMKGNSDNSETLPGWRMDDFLDIPDFDNGGGFYDLGSSKADNASIGEDWTTTSNSIEDDVVENSLALVPEMPSPPTASGLFWPLNKNHQTLKGKLLEDFGSVDFTYVPTVPDIHSPQSDSSPTKKRRMYM